jgi:hypothetical protein
MRMEGLGKLKKTLLIGTRIRDLPACSILPQPTTLPRAPSVGARLFLLGNGSLNTFPLQGTRMQQ